MTNFEMVKEFHDRFNVEHIDMGDWKRFAVSAFLRLSSLRMKLVREEVQELDDALTSVEHVEVADALADILYVTYGAAIAFGIDIDKVFAEVHRSNMTKLGIDGKPLFREDGKIMKGPNYEPPDIVPILTQV